MNPKPGSEASKIALYGSLKGSFGAGLVSALGVVQGVALAELGVVITADLPHLTLVRWFQAGVTFLLLISVWDTISKDALIWKWVPGFQESLIPFFLGGAELFLTYSITLNVSYWLLSIAGLALLRTVGYRHVDKRGREEPEISWVRDKVVTQLRMAQVYSLLGLVVFAALGIGNLTGKYIFEGESLHTTIMVAECVLAFAWVAGAALNGALLWRRIVACVRPAQVSSKQPEAAGNAGGQVQQKPTA